MRQVLDALSVGEVEESESLQNRVSRLTASSVTWTPQKSVETRKLRASVIAGLFVFLFGWLGWQLLTNNFHRSGSPIAIVSTPLPSIEVSQATGQEAKVIDISSYDPLGDNKENSELASLAVDGDSSTAWTTSSYRNADMSGKAGVGLMVDLGTEQEIYAVEIEFISVGHTAELYVINTPQPNFTTAKKFGDADPSKSTSEISGSDSVSGRYVLIWLTPDLPESESGEFQGGISEIKVRL
jgi:hypothetical protein